MAESEEALKALKIRVKEANPNVGLNLNINEIKFVATGPIITWQIDGKEIEAVPDFFLLGFQDLIRW